jgi:hypothetical protein
MTSKRFVSGAVLVGVLSAVPAFAQEARPRRDPGGDRGGRVEQRSGGGGGERRYAAPRHPGGGSYVRQERRQEPARVYQAPRSDARRYQAPRRYEAPRRADNNRRYEAPRRYDAPRTVRRYEAPRYDARRYDNRRYDNRRYDNRGYYNRGYAVPRHPGNYGYSYRPYTYRSYRGSYGYGRRTIFIRPRIITVAPWRPYYYRPRFSVGVYYGAGGVYAYGHTPSYYYDPLPGRIYGGVRITDAPREAQVFADGYYVGIVDDFDGVFQHVNLEAGEHRIEIQAPGMDPLVFDVMVQAGRTITLRADAYGYAGDGYGYDDY